MACNKHEREQLKKELAELRAELEKGKRLLFAAAFMGVLIYFVIWVLLVCFG